MIYFYYCPILGFRYFEIRMDLLPQENAHIPSRIRAKKKR